MDMDFAALPVQDHTDQGIKLIEEERRRIARDLHDGPAQAITNASMRLDFIKRMFEINPENALNEINRIHRNLTGAVNEIRRLIHDLRPLAVDEVGLVSATRQLCEQNCRDWQIKVSFSSDDHKANGISPAKQVAVYRLIGEILNNIYKHAQATEVSVSFLTEKNVLKVVVKDNGIGFDPSNTPPGHYGLIGMKERAEYLNGKFTVQSVIGEGSTFVVQIPLKMRKVAGVSA